MLPSLPWIARCLLTSGEGLEGHGVGSRAYSLCASDASATLAAVVSVAQELRLILFPLITTLIPKPAPHAQTQDGGLKGRLSDDMDATAGETLASQLFLLTASRSLSREAPFTRLRDKSI